MPPLPLSITLLSVLLLHLVPAARAARTPCAGSLPGAQDAIAREYAANKLVLEVLTLASPARRTDLTPPCGWKIVSGGADARADKSASYISASYPLLRADGTPYAWRAEGSSPGVEATAVAIYDPRNLWDVRAFVAETQGDGDLSVTARLPTEEGYELVGGGAVVTGGAAAGDAGKGKRVFLRRLEVVGDDAVRAAVPGGCAPGARKLVAYAIGLRRDWYDVSSQTGRVAVKADTRGAEAAIKPADGYGMTAAGAVVTGSDVCGGFLDMLKPGARGERAFGSARFSKGATANVGLSVTGLMVEAPAMF